MANEQIDGGAFKASAATAAAAATTTTKSKQQDNYRTILVNGFADQLFSEALDFPMKSKTPFTDIFVSVHRILTQAISYFYETLRPGII